MSRLTIFTIMLTLLWLLALDTSSPIWQTAEAQKKQTEAQKKQTKGKKSQRIRDFQARVDPQGNTHDPPPIQVNSGGQITCTQATSSSPINVPGRCVINQAIRIAWKETVPAPSATIYLGCQGQAPCGCAIRVTD